MKNPKKTSRFGGIWKALVLFVLIGYGVSNVLAFDGIIEKEKTLHESWSSSIGNFKNLFSITESKKAGTELPKQIEESVATETKKIWNNLLNFMQGGLTESKHKVDGENSSKDTQASEEKSLEKKSELPQMQTAESKSAIVHILPQSETQILSFFSDISEDENKESIEILASIGVFEANQQGKFYPHNHVRYSDFIRVLVDVYRYKNWYDLNSDYGLVSQSSYPNYQRTLAKKLSTAQSLGMLTNLTESNLENFIWGLQAQQIFNNTVSLNPQLFDPLKISNIDTKKSVLSKSELSKMMVEIFELEEAWNIWNIFRDISGHPSYTAITKLAQLGVVAGKNGNFYPNNHAIRADGISMIANSLAASKGNAIVIKAFEEILNIHDVTYFAPYAPHLEYLLQQGIWASLLYPQEDGNLFLPSATLSKGEAYQLVAEVFHIKIVNLNPQENAKPITRWELAELIVQSTDFYLQEYKAESPNPIVEDVKIAWKEDKKNLLLSLLKVIIEDW